MAPALGDASDRLFPGATGRQAVDHCRSIRRIFTRPRTKNTLDRLIPFLAGGKSVRPIERSLWITGGPYTSHVLQCCAPAVPGRQLHSNCRSLRRVTASPLTKNLHVSARARCPIRSGSNEVQCSVRIFFSDSRSHITGGYVSDWPDC